MARLRAPQLRGTLLCLAAGMAFSVSPVLIQVAYDHGAAVTGVLAWRYLAAAILLVGIARGKMLRVPLRAALGAFVLGAVVYALDSALFFGSLERTSAPLASLVHYAHLVLVVGVAAMIGRERLTRRRLLALVGIFGGVALVGGAAANPDLVGVGMALGSAAAYAVYILLSDRLLRDADPMALAAYLTAGAATSFFVAGGVLGSLGTVGGPAGLACLVGSGTRRLGVRRHVVPQGREARRPVDGVIARNGRGAGDDRARCCRPATAPDVAAARRCGARRRRHRGNAAPRRRPKLRLVGARRRCRSLSRPPSSSPRSGGRSGVRSAISTCLECQARSARAR